MEKGKISSTALVFLLIDLVGATAVVFLPALTAESAGRDAWLVPVITTMPGIAVILIVTELGRRFPGKTIIEYLQIILGTWPGKTVAAFYIFFFIHTNGVIIRQFGELITTMIMPHTPILVLHTTFVLLAAYAVRSGLEVIGRLWEFTFPWVFVLYIFLLFFSFQKAEFHRLLPVLENGLKPVLQGSITPAAWRGEVMLLAMFLPYLAEPSQGRRLGIWSVIILGAILTADAVLNTAMFGPSTERLIFPSFILVNEIAIGGFLRVDIAIVIIWLVTMLIKIALFYYAAVLGTAQLFSIKDYKPITLPIGVILTALSILSIENSVGIPVYTTTAYPPFAYLVEWVIPLIVLFIAAVRGSKAKYSKQN